MTATSVGITARVLSDLGRLQEPESRIVLGAAVIDDVVGLVILTVVAGLAEGNAVTVLSVAKTTGIAFGFLLGTLLIGSLIVPRLVWLASRIDMPGTTMIMALIVAFGDRLAGRLGGLGRDHRRIRGWAACWPAPRRSGRSNTG